MKAVGIQLQKKTDVTRKEIEEGMQLIKLFRRSSPVAGIMIEAIDYTVSIGLVAYEQESRDNMYELYV